ncbi:MAG: MFS transporter [Clostridiales bacterium]|jgi:PPP family 3-phenylpropionic acid transporter|nr:MFS transporter [Clostridiales bacterium]
MKEQTKYRFNYVVYQLGVMFFPYIALYLKERGQSGAEYGAVMSFTPLATALALPFFGILDNGSRGRKILVYAVSALIIVSEWLMVGFGSLTVIMIAVFFASAAKAAYNTSIDGVTTVYCVETGQEFSAYRAFSSLGYILANLAGAFLFDRAGFSAVLIISSVSAVFFALSWSRLKPLSIDGLPRKKEHSYRLLFTNKAFIMFLIYQTLCFTMMTFINNYDIIYQDMRGLPSHVFGITTMIRVGTEILTFFILGKLKRLSYKAMLLAAPLFLLAEAFAYYLFIPTEFIYVLMTSAGIGSGLLIYANNKYLNKIVRPRNVTVGLYVAAMVQNLFVGIATLAGGAAIDRFGAEYLFLGSGVILIAACAFTAVFLKREDKVNAGGDFL